ncbi:MAG TPA: thioredoxin domain-containing protein [Candidatus Thermoplasmatota archaeon]|nr:thioredoxin domain-containing protein [Candidatus Thermoplasmatota archaeon]
MNRLASEKAPYLRTAANQPVHWWPWGDEAFAEAQRTGKPVLLDIGAVWCHWCHVIDRESYENAATARLINERFVPVKVDRDERPDVDARYQKAVAALTGQGGWPLTVFLTADGKPFYGGTYFPPVDMHGRPGFPRVLESVARFYAENRDEAAAQADRILAALARRGGAGAPGEIAPGLIDDAVRHVESEFDAVNGGWGHAPKFPHTSAIDLAIARYRRTGSAALEDVARTTLDRMLDGGVYDHLAGGFHRYSVDARWHVPHFEKMLHDNAGLLANLAHAAQVWPGRGYDAKARDVARFMETVLSDRDHGGFYGSQDADVGHEDDGDFFTWTLDEAAAVLDPEEMRLAALHFGLAERGPMHHDPRRNVLHVAAKASDLAHALGRPVAEVERVLAEVRRKMLAARLERPAPYVDRTLYTNWNGMAVSAFLALAGATGEARYRDFARLTLDRFLDEAWSRERGFAHGLADDGTPLSGGLLDDQAQMLPALLDAHDHTGNRRYLDAAVAVADLLERAFAAPGGGLRDHAPDLAGPGSRVLETQVERPIQDNPTPSANATAARALVRLAAATGDARHRDHARRILEAFAAEAPRYGLFAAAWFLAADALLSPPPQVLVVARGEAADAMRAAALRAYAPGRVVRVIGDAAEPGVPEEARALAARAAGPTALVCLGERCLAPADSPAALETRLAEAGKT